ncbi:hypothetical protein D6T51_16805 [Salmonella enterica subsp. enterica serovar Muenchen]|nr:hypothetical protein [Salmonella enterica subsp. enterica serovar Muenchen]EBV7251998.1 hypothetical protein [Salmonella enterica subsp. enterica serovar Pomona]
MCKIRMQPPLPTFIIYEFIKILRKIFFNIDPFTYLDPQDGIEMINISFRMDNSLISQAAINHIQLK